jgi:hypothetical protein
VQTYWRIFSISSSFKPVRRRRGRLSPDRRQTPPSPLFCIAPQGPTRYLTAVRSLFPILAAACLFIADTAAAAAPSQTVLLSPPPSEGPLPVGIGFQLLDIITIDDQSETFEFSGILSVQWKDERQAFDPAAEGVTEKFYQGNFQFNEISPGWYPEVALLNVAGLLDKGEPLFRIRPDGTCTLLSPVNATAKSELKLRHYPFDRQNLQIIFGIPGYTQSEITVQPLPVAALDPAEIRVPQWTLKGTRSMADTVLPTSPGADGRTSAFVLEMDVKRQGAFVMRLVVGPLLLVVILSWSVFWMDHSSVGDRMAVSFVGLLTAVAYQIVLGDILPHISYLTPVNVFVNVSFMIMCASIVVNLIVGEFNRSNRAAEADILDRRCRKIFPLVYASLLAGTMLFFAIVF